MKIRSFHLFTVLLALFFLVPTGITQADLNHYVAAPDDKEEDPCQKKPGDAEDPANPDDPCKEDGDDDPQNDQGCAANEGGDPFNLHSGEFKLSKTYLSQPGGALSFSLFLSYSSYSDVHTTIGYGWTHNFNMRLHETSQGRLVWVNHKGALVFFNSTGSNSYVSDDIWNTKAVFANGVYTLTTTSGKKYVFDAEGRLTSIVHSSGSNIQLTYAPDGAAVTRHPVTCIPRNSNLTTPTTVVRDYRVHKVEEFLANASSTGRFLEFSYYADSGLLDFVVDQAGRKVDLTHDAANAGNLVTLAETLTETTTLSSHYSYYMAVQKNISYYGYMETFSREGCSDCTQRKNYYYNGGIYSGWVSRQVQGEHGEGEDIAVQYTTTGNNHTVTLTHNINVFNPGDNSLISSGSWQEEITYITDSRDNRRVKRRTKKRPNAVSPAQPGGTGDYYVEYSYYGEDAADVHGVDGAYLDKVKTKRDYDGSVTHTTYNTNGLVLSETSPVSDTVNHISSYQYDALNNLTKTTITQTDRPSESFVTEYEYYAGTRLLRFSKQKKGDNDYIITEYTYYPSGNDSENLLKDAIQRHNGTVLRTTRSEYTTSADASQPVGLLKKTYDLDDPTYHTSYHYTLAGNADVVTDAKGNTRESDFDTKGRVVESRIKDASGTLLTKTIRTYSGSNLTEVKTGNDTDGYRIVRYGYDSLNRRNKTTRVATGSGSEVEMDQNFMTYRSDGKILFAENALGQISTYNYADNALPWKTSVQTPWRDNAGTTEYATGRYWYNSHGRAYLKQEPGGTFTLTEYDGIGRVSRRHLAYGSADVRISEQDYDAMGNIVDRRVISSGATLLGSTHYFYDALSRQLGVNWNPTTDVKQGDFARPAKFTYDDSNFTTTVTDARGNSSSVVTDRFGRAIRGQSADRADYLAARPQDGNDVTSVFDVLGRRTQSTDGRGIHRYFHYDSFSRLTHTSVETAADWSSATWWTNASNVSAEVKTYSPWSEVLEVWDTDRILSTSSFDSLGRLTSRARTGSPTISYRYTDLHLLEYVDYPAQPAAGNSPAHPATSIHYVYDSKNGAVLKNVTDRAGNTTAYTYTPRFQRETILTSLNAASPKYKRLTYDVFGRVVTSQNEDDDLTTIGYDALGNVAKVYHPDHPYTNGQPDSASTVGVENFTYNTYNQVLQHTGTGTYPIEFAYDLAGNRQSMTDNKSQASGALFSGGTRTYWEYDSVNRVSRKYYNYQNAGSYSDDREYSYNGNGAMKTSRDGKGVTTQYAYEPGRNLLQTVDFPNDTDHQFTYDKARRRTQMQDASGITGWQYDSLGRLEIYTQNSTDRLIHYKYDTWSRMAERRVRPVGTAEGVAGEWLTAYDYDHAGRLLHITDHRVNTTTPFTYQWHDNADLVERITFPSGAKQEKDYDVLGRLKLIEAYNQANTKINSFGYDYNNVGQREKITLADGSKINLLYDEKRQLNTAKKLDAADAPVASYDYDYDFDAIGNRTQGSVGIPPALTTYTPNALNQYTTINPSTGPPVNPTHDDNGSLLSNAHISNTWNEENRLKTIADTTANTRSETIYDANGRRIERRDYNSTTAGALIKTTRYLYEGWNCLAEYDLQNSTLTLEKSYTWGMDLSGSSQGAGGVGGLLAIMDSGFSHEVTYDGNGNVSDLLDAAGNVTAHYEYDPFGNTIVKSGTYADANTYRFSTKPLNTHAGSLYYYGYRYYDTLTGRWMSKDPLGELGGVNLYGFVGNGSINSWDYLGLSSPGQPWWVPDFIDQGLRGIGMIENDHHVMRDTGAHLGRVGTRVYEGVEATGNSLGQEAAYITSSIKDPMFWDEYKTVWSGRKDGAVEFGQLMHMLATDPEARRRIFCSLSKELRDRYSGPDGFMKAIEDGQVAAIGFLQGQGVAKLLKIAKGVKIRPHAPKSVVDKSWKAKIHGSGQKTGTPGHQFRMYREAIAEAKNPNVTSVHLDHGYNRALGLNPKTISPNRRPDVTSIYDNGMVRRVEVQSRTDVPSILSGRNSALDPQLIQNGFTPTPPVIIRPTTSP